MFNRPEAKVLSNIEPQLKQIIETLRATNLERAGGLTAELIEAVLRMSNPLYREDKTLPRSHHAPASLRTLVEDLRLVSFTMRRGTPADALLLAERALAVFVKPEAVAH